MSTERTAVVNALTALLRVVDLQIDAREPLTGTQIGDISRWRARHGEEIGAATARTEAIRLAKQITSLDTELSANKARMDKLVQTSPAAPLLGKVGIEPVTAAIVLTAWSHHGRLRSEAAFDALAGVNPIPASSGTPCATSLTKEVIDASTAPCTWPSSPAWSTTPKHAPTPRDDAPRAAPTARSAAA